MKKFSLALMVLAAIGFTACTEQNKPGEQPQQQIIKAQNKMKNLVSIIEIPVSDLKKATGFYSAVLGVSIEEAEMGGVKMGILPNEKGTVNVVLAQGSDYKPSNNSGSILYLNGGDDLQAALDKVEPNGGKILLPKTAISPEMGFFALFLDTEGNKMGLHSMH